MVFFSQKLHRRFFKKLFSSLLLGSRLLFVGSPSEISNNFIQKEIFRSGCLYADSSYRAKVFLSKINPKNKPSNQVSLTLPSVVLVYDVAAHQEVVAYAREKSIPVLGIFCGKNAKINVDFPLFLSFSSSQRVLYYWIILYSLKKFRKAVALLKG